MAGSIDDPDFALWWWLSSPIAQTGSKQNLKYHAQPNQLYDRPKGPLGGPGPQLLSPIPPWFRPERRKSLFWPSSAGYPPSGPQKGSKKAPKLKLRWGCPRGMLRWLWEPQGHGPSRVCGGCPCAAWNPPRYAHESCCLPAVDRVRGPRGHKPKSGNSDPARFQN